MPNESNATTQCRVQVANIYATSWRYRPCKDDQGSSVDLSEKLNLGDLKKHYELYKDQLPRPLDGPCDADHIDLAEGAPGIRVDKVEAMLFALPSNQVVITITLDFTTPSLEEPHGVAAITQVLDQGIEGRITVRGLDLSDYVNELPDHVGEPLKTELTREKLAGYGDGDGLLPERHQLVFIARGHPEEDVPSEAIIDEILYREKPPYREEFTHQEKPEQLNLFKPAGARGTTGQWLPKRRAEQEPVGRQTALGVVTQYVSLLYGHESFVRVSAFLSTVHAVGTAYRFRQIWHDAYHQVSLFREKQEAEVGLQTRDSLEELADRLGNLEFDLTFSVEFPLMRIETFKTALYEVMDLSNQARALSQMFNQLGGSLRSEITAIDVRDRRRDEGRQRWNAFAAGVLSVIGVSVGFVIAFLGINTTEVPDGQLSMWNPHFRDLYLIAGLFALIPTFFIAFPYVRDWALARRDRKALWRGFTLLVIGVAMLVATAFVDRIGSTPAIVVDAVLKAVAGIALLFGVSLIGLWRWPTVKAGWLVRGTAKARER